MDAAIAPDLVDADPVRAGDRVAVVVNPATRRQAAAIVDLLQREVPPGVELDVRLTTATGTATALAREMVDGARMVVAVGGDGTASDVATGLLGTDVPLGIISAGSTNIVAREQGIPTKPLAAIRLLFGRHRLTTLDVGRCGERAFLHMAGAGIDSRLFDNASVALKRRIGWLAYLPPAVRSVLQAPVRFTITTDDVQTELTSPLVLVANGQSIAVPYLSLYPGLRKDDGWLDVVIFTAHGALPVARTVARFGTRSLQRSPYVIRLRAKHVELCSDPPLPVELDGDVVQHTPAAFDIAPAALRLIVPPR